MEAEDQGVKTTTFQELIEQLWPEKFIIWPRDYALPHIDGEDC